MKKPLLFFIINLGWLSLCAQQTDEVERIELKAEVKRNQPVHTEVISLERGAASTPESTAEDPFRSHDSTSNPSSNSTYQGITEGKASVSLSGGFSYEVPIAVPPGVKGAVPNLSLSYNGQGGSGVAGYGWNISGLSTIAHIPSDLYHNGFIAGVSLGSEDALSLDGQRLIPVTGTSQEYQTENFSNVKIVKYYGDFRVYYPDGSSAEYDDLSHWPVLEYPIKSWKDKQGNEIQYEYAFSDRTARISKIKYGGGKGKELFNEIRFIYKTRSKPILSYVNGYSFKRTHVLSEVQVYANGHMLRKYHLEHDVTEAGQQQVRSITEYNDSWESKPPIRFYYKHSENTASTRDFKALYGPYNDWENIRFLSGDFDGDGFLDFLGYNQSDKDLLSIYTGGGQGQMQLPLGSLSNFKAIFPSKTLDERGRLSLNDGVTLVKESIKDDQSNYSQVKFYSSQRAAPSSGSVIGFLGSKTIDFPSAVYEEGDEYCAGDKRAVTEDPRKSMVKYVSKTKIMPKEFVSGDFNGDGITDVLAIEEGHSYTQRWLKGRKTSSRYSKPFSGPFHPYVIGFEDCSYETSYTSGGSVYWADLNTKNAMTSAEQVGYIPSFDKYKINFQTGDYNGDGKTDLFVIQDGKVEVYGLDKDNDLKKIAEKSDSWIKKDKYIDLADFNGDGKVDLLVPEKEGSSRWELLISDGDDYFITKFASITSYQKRDNRFAYRYLVSDFNRDGKSDLLKVSIPYYVQTRYLGTSLDLYTFNGLESSAAALNGGLSKNQPATPLDLCSHRSTRSFGYEDEYGEYQPCPPREEPYDEVEPWEEEVVQRHPSPSRTTRPVYAYFTHKKTLRLDNIYIDTPMLGGDINMNTRNPEIGFYTTTQAYGGRVGQIKSVSFNQDLREDTTLDYVYNGGNGKKLEIHYSNEDNHLFMYYDDTYTKAYDDTAYPYININNLRDFRLVHKLEEWVNGKNYRWQDFHYYGAVSHARGLGFLGFRGRAQSNWHGSSEQTLWTASLHNPELRGAATYTYVTKYYLPFERYDWGKTDNIPEDVISKTHYEYTTQAPTAGEPGVYINFPQTVTTTDKLTGVTTTKTFAYDSYWNPTSVITDYNGAGTAEDRYEYLNNPSGTDGYYMARVKKEQSISRAYGSTFESSTEYTYDEQGNAVQIVKKGNGNEESLTEQLTYDSFGNITRRSLSGTGAKARVESFEYDATGRFVTEKTEVQGQVTGYENDLDTGLLLSETDHLGRRTAYTYDGWNRPLTITDYLSHTKRFDYAYNPEDSGGFLVKEYNPEAENKQTYYDRHGRAYKTKVLSLNSQWITKEVKYDASDRKYQQSEPYIAGGATQWTRTEYDRYGRVEKVTAPTGRTLTTSYEGLSVSVDDGVQTKTTVKDALGNVVSQSDAGGTITYTYYANGNQKSSSYAGNVIRVEQDAWGRKTKLTDPSAGEYRYEYNIFGQVLKEINPKGKTERGYDDTGRLIRSTLTEGDKTYTTTYTYDTTTQLLTRTDSQTDDKNSMAYRYDEYGRPVQIIEDNTRASYTTELAYDEYGRKASETRKTEVKGKDTATELSRSTVIEPGRSIVFENSWAYEYERGSGLLRQITDGQGKTLYKVESLNARGQLLQAALGNGIKVENTYDAYGYLTKQREASLNEAAMDYEYTFDKIRGNLLSRKNYALTNHYAENFTYDRLDRLTKIENTETTSSMGYDAQGRITSSSALGVYHYNSTQGASMFQVKEVELNEKGKERFAGREHQEAVFTAFKKPRTIQEAGSGEVSFEYNGGLTRSFAEIKGEGQTRSHRIKLYNADQSTEVVEDVNTGQTQLIQYMGSPYKARIAYIAEYDRAGELTQQGMYYLHRDYLGSIVGISDSGGKVFEKRHYGAWGALEKYESSNTSLTAAHPLLDRGWTGHEYFAVVHLVHMNGRMYDTDLRRFLSPDNYVQDPTNTQNYNRYQYGYNNPLKYSDPSGEFFFAAIIVGAIIGAFVGAGTYVVNAIKTGHWSWKGFGASILKGAVAGGISGLIAPGAVMGGLLSNGIGGTIGMGVLANSLPSLHIPIGDFSIDISPAIAFGKSFSIGANIRASYHDGNFNASVGFGVSFAGRAAGSGARGWEYRRSFGAGWDDGHQGFGVYSTIFSGFGGKFNQQIGGLSYRNGDFGFRYENDGAPFSNKLGDGDDKYRTAALAINIGEFSAGINLFTGRRDEDSYEIEKGSLRKDFRDQYGRRFRRGYVDEQGSKYRLGALYLGYNGYRIGTNSEHVRHAFQNWFAHSIISPQPGFQNTSWDWQPYFQYQSPNIFSLW